MDWCPLWSNLSSRNLSTSAWTPCEISASCWIYGGLGCGLMPSKDRRVPGRHMGWCHCERRDLERYDQEDASNDGLALSAGDVVLHTITDAILGALCQPDIGQLFPDSDPKYGFAALTSQTSPPSMSLLKHPPKSSLELYRRHVLHAGARWWLPFLCRRRVVVVLGTGRRTAVLQTHTVQTAFTEPPPPPGYGLDEPTNCCFLRLDIRLERELHTPIPGALRSAVAIIPACSCQDVLENLQACKWAWGAEFPGLNRVWGSGFRVEVVRWPPYVHAHWRWWTDAGRFHRDALPKSTGECSLPDSCGSRLVRV